MRINFEELAFVTKIPVRNAKKIFQLTLKNAKVTSSDTAETKDLEKHFQKMSSHDKRYDGKSLLEISLRMIHLTYKKHLSDDKVKEAGEWIGGMTIFNKVLTKEQQAHAKERMKSYE